MYRSVTALSDRLQWLELSAARIRAMVVRELLATRTTREVARLIGRSPARVGQPAAAFLPDDCANSSGSLPCTPERE